MSVRSIPLIFEDVAAANSFGARKKVLLENESNPLKDLLKYAFHPDIKFALPTGVPPIKQLVLLMSTILHIYIPILENFIYTLKGAMMDLLNYEESNFLSLC